MNKAVKAMYPDMDFYESPNGIPVMECRKLPEGARRIEFAEDLMAKVSQHCVRINEMGLPVPDYGKAYPVFILSMELEGREAYRYYRVNFVSPSEGSREMACRYIAEGKLYAVM